MKYLSDTQTFVRMEWIKPVIGPKTQCFGVQSPRPDPDEDKERRYWLVRSGGGK